MGGKICRIFHQSARPMPEELRRPISKLGHAPNTGDWLWHVAMDQYLLIPFLGGWTSINPSYFDVNYRGTRFWHTAMWGLHYTLW